MKNLWKPIGDLKDLYSTNLLLCAPELVDLDCNVHGVGMGYYQDAPNAPGKWLACKWSMTNDEWFEVVIKPTHFLIIEGP